MQSQQTTTTAMVEPPAETQPPTFTIPRVAYLDKLKVGLTILVIAHHAGQSYGPTGGSWPIFNDEQSALLGPFFSVNAAFFMGLFFLISGYFTPHSLDRKGTASFLKNRFIRFGIPVFLHSTLVTIPIVYFVQGQNLSFTEYFFFLKASNWQAVFWHLWFLLHLLVYNGAYALWRHWENPISILNQCFQWEISHSTILVFGLALSTVTAFVRIWYPIDTWAPFLYVIPMEIAHLPQYVSLFVIGIMAYRRDWFHKLPYSIGMVWLKIGFILAVGRYIYSLLGGWEMVPWLSHFVVWSFWETFICLGLSIGLIAFLRERFNQLPTKLMRFLGETAYAAFIVHAILVIGLQFSLDSVNFPPFGKFLMVTCLGTLFSFGVGRLLKSVPGAKKVL